MRERYYRKKCTRNPSGVDTCPLDILLDVGLDTHSSLESTIWVVAKVWVMTSGLHQEWVFLANVKWLENKIKGALHIILLNFGRKKLTHKHNSFKWQYNNTAFSMSFTKGFTGQYLPNPLQHVPVFRLSLMMHYSLHHEVIKWSSLTSLLVSTRGESQLSDYFLLKSGQLGT